MVRKKAGSLKARCRLRVISSVSPYIICEQFKERTFSGLLYSQARNAVHDTGKALVLASQSQLASMRTIAGTKHIFI